MKFAGNTLIHQRLIAEVCQLLPIETLPTSLLYHICMSSTCQTECCCAICWYECYLLIFKGVAEVNAYLKERLQVAKSGLSLQPFADSLRSIDSTEPPFLLKLEE